MPNSSDKNNSTSLSLVLFVIAATATILTICAIRFINNNVIQTLIVIFIIAGSLECYRAIRARFIKEPLTSSPNDDSNTNFDNLKNSLSNVKNYRELMRYSSIIVEKFIDIDQFNIFIVSDDKLVMDSGIVKQLEGLNQDLIKHNCNELSVHAKPNHGILSNIMEEHKAKYWLFLGHNEENPKGLLIFPLGKHTSIPIKHRALIEKVKPAVADTITRIDLSENVLDELQTLAKLHKKTVDRE